MTKKAFDKIAAGLTEALSIARKFDRNKWWPLRGISCVWLSQEWTESEAILGAALQKLVAHDRAAAMREGIDGCIELQHAERVLAFYAKTAKILP